MHAESAGRTAVYRVYDASRVLLYVGVSNSFGRRWTAHAKAQPWWPEVEYQTVTWYESRKEALSAEAAAIRAEQPRFNVVHNRPMMSHAELLSLPVSVDLMTAARALGIGHGLAARLAQADAFPCRVLRVGKKYRVPRSAIFEALGIDPAQARAPLGNDGPKAA